MLQRGSVYLVRYRLMHSNAQRRGIITELTSYTASFPSLSSSECHRIRRVERKPVKIFRYSHIPIVSQINQMFRRI